MAGPRRTTKRLKNVLSLKGQVTTAELVKRLKALHEELEAMEQDVVETSSLGSTSKELISKTLLAHKDKSVKAYTACCLADLLRLYAPDAPYTEHELKDIFSFFFSQLRNLAKVGDIHTAQYHYLLKNLSEVKSVCLICELPGADELLIRVFDDLFDSMPAQSTSRSVEMLAADILSQLIDEMGTVPGDVVARILAQFDPRNVKSRPHTLRVAIQVCNDTSDKLQRYVSQYFVELLGTAVDDAMSDEGADDGDDDLGEIKRAHALIKEINRASPGLLLNVIPQLEAQLKVGNTALRTLATKTLGDMLAEPADLARPYPTLWSSWIGRAADKASTVRTTVLEALKPILSNHAVLAKEIQQVLESKLMDPDEKVRIAACSVFGGLEYETALQYIKLPALKALAERTHDKRPHVVSEALKALGRLYSLAYSAIEEPNEAAVEQFAWIPASILDSARIADLDLQATVLGVLLQYILPLPKAAEDEEIWVDRFVLVYSLLEPLARTQLRRIANIEGHRPVFSSFIAACEKYNGGVIDENEEEVTANLKKMSRQATAQFPNAGKASEELIKFAKLNDNRLYKLLRTMMDPQVELKSLLKSHQEFQRRVGEAAPTLVDTMTLFVRRSAYLFLGRSSIPTLLNLIETPPAGVNGENAMMVATELLTTIAKNKAAMFRPHLERLTELLSIEDNVPLVDVALLALKELAKAEKLEVDDDLQERASHFVQHGSLLQAKSAATVLARATTTADQTALLVGTLADELKQTEGMRLVVHIGALASFAKYAPAAFADSSDIVTDFVMREVLLKADPSEMEVDGEEDWATDDALGYHGQACLAGLKLLTNRCIAYGASADALTVAKPVFKLLLGLLDSGGDVHTVRHPPPVASRLRCLAAISLLRLASVKAYEAEVLAHFELLAWTMQDPVFQVRHAFLTKVVLYLFRQRLTNPIFNLILFLVAHDPEQENKNMASANIRNRVRSLPQDARIQHFERIFARLLHLLAHHPDFSTEPEDIAMTAEYIRFYLANVASAENVSYLYHLSAVLKTVRDAASQGHSDLLYVISEVAQHLIKAVASAHGWSISPYTGKVTIPQDLFKPLPSAEVTKTVMKTTYLDAEGLAALNEALKLSVPAKARRWTSLVRCEETGFMENVQRKAGAAPRRRRSPKPKATSGPKKPAAKRRKKEKEWNEDDASDHESDLDGGATSEEEAKPTGSKSRPKAAAANGGKKGRPSNGHRDEDEDEEAAPRPAKGKSKVSPPKGSGGTGKKARAKPKAATEPEAMSEDD